MSKTWLRIISVLEMIGGVVGVGFVISRLTTAPLNPYTLLAAPIPFGIYILSFIAGLLLWKDKRAGRTASIIVQAIQIPKIYSPLLIFVFSFGFDLWPQLLIINGEYLNYGVELKFLAFIQFFINSRNAPIGFGFSVTAVIFLIVLIRHQPQAFLNNKEMSPPQPNELLEPND